jgi:hypothetical protein
MDRPSITRKSVGSGLGLLVRHLGAVGGASALALAGVLGFAAVVAGLATALTLAGVLAFTGVLFFYFLAGGLDLVICCTTPIDLKFNCIPQAEQLP